ncbi:MAG TPA: metalloregulator ArsR/SmtB family transcription factor [Anaerolineales bacterium]|nr:metalloregulator ArsR/SmtB family transcription factor [Anaerolineales bacterium]HRQ92130.1 metalloregulator ArsR/SmtB family transcription factor [Anaerolineales bacterium]
MSTETELLDFFKALAEPKRLKIAGILAQGPCAVEELASLLELSEPTVSHHLAVLGRAGLVSARAEGHYSIYELRKDRLESLAERLLAKETLPAVAHDVDMQAYDRAVMRNFSGADGKLKALPAQRKKFEVILRHAATLFKPGKRYPEKEVNKILAALHEDTASLRRGLIEIQLMQRANGEYWLVS